VLLLGVRFFAFISKYAVNVLYFDQWDLLTPLFRGSPTLKGLFLTQLGPPRAGVGLIATWLLYSATRWNTRAEQFLIGGCIFTAMLLALAIKRKLFGAFTYSDVAIPLIFLTLIQFETLVGTPDPAHSAVPLLLIMLYLAALLVRRAWLRYSLVLLANFLLIYTGFGVFMGLVTLALFALECYRSARGLDSTRLALPLAGLLVAGASLGSFFVNYVFLPAVDCFGSLGYVPWPYAEFMGLMFVKFVGSGIPQHFFMALGPAALIVLVTACAAAMARLARSKDPSRGALAIATLLGFSFLFSLNTAIGRACQGPVFALTSRYATLLIPGYLGLYFWFLSIPFARLRRAAITLLMVLLLPGIFRTPPEAQTSADGKRAWAACYLRAGNVADCDRETHFSIYPSPELTGLGAKLEYLRQNRLGFFADAERK
jgi:hypothetical protein